MAIDLRPFKAFNRYVHSAPGDPDVIDLRPYRLVNRFFFVSDSEITFNVIGSVSFDPLITTTVDTATWDFGDGSGEVVSNNPTHVYADTNTYGVKMTLPDIETLTKIDWGTDGITGALDISEMVNISDIRLNNNTALTSVVNPSSTATFSFYKVDFCDITGNLDLSPLVNLGGELRFNNNANLTSITNPTSNKAINRYQASSCDLTGALDLSGLTGLGGFVTFNSNPNLTSIAHPTSSQSITHYEAIGCSSLTSLDLSGLTGLSSRFRVNSCASLSSITMPTTASAFATWYAFTCGLTGVLDLSGLTGLAGDVRVYGNSAMTSITNPSTSGVFSRYLAESCDLGYIDFTVFSGTSNGVEIRLQNNGMTATEVNHILVDLDASGWINGSVNLSGTNSAPDGTSGGFDGLTAKTNLITNGWTVTTN